MSLDVSVFFRFFSSPPHTQKKNPIRRINNVSTYPPSTQTLNLPVDGEGIQPFEQPSLVQLDGSFTALNVAL